MDITSGITGFFSVFAMVYDYMVNRTFIIGGIQFSYASLMWSIVALTIFVRFLFKLLNS